ncbi:MAG: alpha/beta hydrolase, partial [Phenylobacterium sp.]|nr:alpha/beta hydrolase [Phenylobacterium sp.]
MLSLILVAALFGPVATPVTLPSEPAPLHGTLLTPSAETRAAALIIAGSGPTDRDGNSGMGVSASSYRLLAEGLAAPGVATVRTDKRGVGESAAALTSEAGLVFTDYADDARAWAAEAARLTGQPCAWLIGHSEGALVALAAV